MRSYTLICASFIDRGEQYFVAGALRSESSNVDETVTNEPTWFGHDSLPISEGLCMV